MFRTTPWPKGYLALRQRLLGFIVTSGRAHARRITEWLREGGALDGDALGSDAWSHALKESTRGHVMQPRLFSMRRHATDPYDEDDEDNTYDWLALYEQPLDPLYDDPTRERWEDLQRQLVTSEDAMYVVPDPAPPDVVFDNEENADDEPVRVALYSEEAGAQSIARPTPTNFAYDILRSDDDDGSTYAAEPAFMPQVEPASDDPPLALSLVTPPSVPPSRKRKYNVDIIGVGANEEAANQKAARCVKEANKLPFLFMVSDKPDEETVKDVIRLIVELAEIDVVWFKTLERLRRINTRWATLMNSVHDRQAMRLLAVSVAQFATAHTEMPLVLTPEIASSTTAYIYITMICQLALVEEGAPNMDAALTWLNAPRFFPDELARTKALADVYFMVGHDLDLSEAAVHLRLAALNSRVLTDNGASDDMHYAFLWGRVVSGPEKRWTGLKEHHWYWLATSPIAESIRSRVIWSIGQIGLPPSSTALSALSAHPFGTLVALRITTAVFSAFTSKLYARFTRAGITPAGAVPYLENWCHCSFTDLLYQFSPTCARQMLESTDLPTVLRHYRQLFVFAHRALPNVNTKRAGEQKLIFFPGGFSTTTTSHDVKAQLHWGDLFRLWFHLYRTSTAALLRFIGLELMAAVHEDSSRFANAPAYTDPTDATFTAAALIFRIENAHGARTEINEWKEMDIALRVFWPHPLAVLKSPLTVTAHNCEFLWWQILERNADMRAVEALTFQIADPLHLLEDKRQGHIQSALH